MRAVLKKKYDKNQNMKCQASLELLKEGKVQIFHSTELKYFHLNKNWDKYLLELYTSLKTLDTNKVTMAVL